MDIITPRISLLYGDCLERMRQLPENCIDAVVTDPPYGLGFMGKHWDHGVPAADVWVEVLRVLKPGGYLLPFAGTRTQHRMCCNIEDAGFEIRDMIAWIYGTGFPKSLNISKAIDKAAGVTRTESEMRSIIHADSDCWGVPGKNSKRGKGTNNIYGTLDEDIVNGMRSHSLPATPEAIQWDGWGTALKPALEPITVARKPFPGTVAANVLEHGVGGMNIDACRVASGDNLDRMSGDMSNKRGNWGLGEKVRYTGSDAGRFPANLIHDGSEEVLALFPQTGKSTGGGMKDLSKGKLFQGETNDNITKSSGFGDSGSAARFFYCAKASKADRDAGLLPNMPTTTGAERLNRKEGSAGLNSPRAGAGRTSGGTRNDHPTVKPEKLMRYLCKLVTPPGGVVLDPFMGSGSTGRAALLEGFGFVGVEMDPTYYGIAAARILDLYNAD